ncbi:MAG: TonB-dependent receptor [Gammaproteobacteria bacterium]|jgi:Fe(3+) dicitrate transport protein|nr:TonB-dependent receptor [Gammaproteobacteria bacterium]
MKIFKLSILSFFLIIALPISADDKKISIENITIIGEKTLPGSATKVTVEDLEKFETMDVHKALASVPGINVRPEEGYGLRPNISIRGTYPDRSGKITLMEDGILIAPAPYAASSAYYFPTFSRINAIEVVKGPSAIKTGPYTIGGAINLISTPIPISSKGFLNQEFGSDGNVKSHLYYGSSSKRLGFLIEGLKHETDGFDDMEHTNGDTGFDKTDLVVKLRFNNDPNADVYQQVDIKFQDSEEISEQTYVGLTENDYRSNAHMRYGFTDYDQMDNEHDQIVMSYNMNTENIDFSATYYKNDFARDWFKTDKIGYGGSDKSINNLIDYANTGDALAISVLRGTNATAESIKLKHNNRSYSSEGIVLKSNINLNNQTITIGYRDTEDDEDRMQWYERTNWVNGTLSGLVAGSMPGYSSNNRVTTAKANAFFISDEIQFENLTITAGIRSENWKIVQERYVDTARTAVNSDQGYPKILSDDNESLFGIGFDYSLQNGYSIFGGFHEGFTPTTGGSDPESADNLEVGLRYNSDNLAFEIIRFDTDYANMFGECRASSSGVVEGCDIGDTFNAGASSISGYEISASTSYVNEAGVKISANMSYTDTDAEFDTTFDSNFWGNVTAGMNLPNLPETQLTMVLSVETVSGWNTNLRMMSYGDTCSIAACGSNTGIDSYSITDLSLQKEVNEKTDFYMVIDNITDSENIVARAPKNGIRVQRPRSYNIGVRYRF